jgi:hypothetical protein
VKNIKKNNNNNKKVHEQYCSVMLLDKQTLCWIINEMFGLKIFQYSNQVFFQKPEKPETQKPT